MKWSKLKQDEFIKKANEIHANKYDYSKVYFLGKNKKIIIICKTHGEFKQVAISHVPGKNGEAYGCKKCSVANRVLTQNEFICSAKKEHGDLYDYSKSVYKKSSEKLIIICKIHGEFKQRPANHCNGEGCFKCHVKRTTDTQRTTLEEIDKCLLCKNIKRIGADYKNKDTPIEFECLICLNHWNASFGSIKSNKGCPKCNDIKVTDEEIETYLLENNRNIKKIDKLINMSTNINWKCLICNYIWSAKPCSIIVFNKKREPGGCPSCSINKNEKIVKEFIRSKNILTEKLYIKLPISKKFARPEFYFYYLSKEWRDVNAPHTNASEKYPNLFNPLLDFAATWGYSMHQSLLVRNQEHQQYALQFFKEAAQDTICTLTKPADPVKV